MISRGLHTELLIHVRQGLKQPEAPMQAAKFASEGGIILRGHIPILTAGRTTRPKMKNISRTTLANWRCERCTTNTGNRGLVRYPQCTRSRSYVAQAYVVRKRQVEGDPTPIDLFKNVHCSKNSYTTPAQAAIIKIFVSTFSPNMEMTNKRLSLKQWLKLSNLGHFGRLLESEMGALRLRAEMQETTMKSRIGELKALNNTTKQLHTLISSLIHFSTSQNQVNPSLN
uniref:Uncharacterized protein n=1 Tax=Setaria italica TaxID=4555 RepID=K3XS15_SETIT